MSEIASFMKFSRVVTKIRNISGDEILFRLSRKGRQFYDRFVKSRLGAQYQLQNIIRPNESQQQLSPLAYKDYWNKKKSFYFFFFF